MKPVLRALNHPIGLHADGRASFLTQSADHHSNKLMNEICHGDA